MNLFVVDENPEIAAKQLCNKHIVKMPTETANMLLWPFQKLGAELPKTKSNTIIKLSHENHPATKWLMESYDNYVWAFLHLEALCIEYKKRFKRTHFAENYLNFCSERMGMCPFPTIERTPFVKCFSIYKDVITEPDPVKAYRQFYILDKPFARWPSIDAIPDWWPERSDKFVDKNFVNGNYIKR